jgi:hypothetical protein
MRLVGAVAGSSIFMALAPGTVAGLVPWWLTGASSLAALKPAGDGHTRS